MAMDKKFMCSERTVTFSGHHPREHRLYNKPCKKCTIPWNNGNRDPGWGVAEIQKMSPPTTVGDVADMQLCVIKQGSPPVLGNVAFFVTDLLTLARCAVCILVR